MAVPMLKLKGSPHAVDTDRGSIFFVGTATVVIRYAGFTILTDPNFLHAGDHVHLGYGLFSRRLTDPAMEIEQLPPLDLVILSHYHGDHFDRVAESRLAKDVPIVTTRHAAARLRSKRFTRTLPLDTWGTLRVEKGPATLDIRSMPAKHGPGLVRSLLPPVMGSLLDFSATPGRALRMYISGDTLVHEELHEIARRYRDIDLGLFHLGGTRILGILLTMDAEQGVRAIRIVDPREAIPIHYNDYGVFKSSLQDFQRAVTAAGLDDRVRYLAHGQTHHFQVTDAARARRPA
jgi:L-ascorbate metabolism protein UlaG (beta-lactamase superfamily)